MNIEEFKKTNDYRDICYFIKHVPYVNTRIGILRELGYTVIPKKIINSKKELKTNVTSYNSFIYVQVTNRMERKDYAWFIKIQFENK